MKNNKSKRITQAEADSLQFDSDMQYVRNAHDCLLIKLFGFIPDIPSNYCVSRRAYVKAMEEVQREFDLKEGNPRLLLFILEQLSRSPRFFDSPTKNKKKVK